jgi:hypothetical protein
MAKVEGSNPFIRFDESPGDPGLSCVLSRFDVAGRGKVRWDDLSDLPRKVPWMSKHGKRSQASRQSRAPSGPWSVRFHSTARAEADAVPTQESKAIDNAVDKLASLGPMLPFPHSSKVMGDPADRCVSCDLGLGAARGGASTNGSATCS